MVSKWYHLRTVYCLAAQLPEAAPFHAISWEPVYAGTLVTRAAGPRSPTAAAGYSANPRKSPAASPKEPTAPPGRLTEPGCFPNARTSPSGGRAADSFCFPPDEPTFSVQCQIEFSFLVSWHFLASPHLPALIAVNDHEPLIAHPGSYDADA